MRTIEANAVVTQDGQLVIQMPTDLLPGEHRAVIVVDEQPLKAAPRRQIELPVFDLGPWPENLSLRREDMYGDDGR